MEELKSEGATGNFYDNLCILKEVGLPKVSMEELKSEGAVGDFYVGMAWEKVRADEDIVKLKERLKKVALASLSESLEVLVKTKTKYRGVRKGTEFEEFFLKVISTESFSRLARLSFSYSYEPTICLLVVRVFIRKDEAKRIIGELRELRELITWTQNLLTAKECKASSLRTLRGIVKRLSFYEPLVPEVKGLVISSKNLENYCRQRCSLCPERIGKASCDQIKTVSTCIGYLEDTASLFATCSRALLTARSILNERRTGCIIESLQKGTPVEEVRRRLGKPERIMDGTFYGLPLALKYGNFWLLFENFSLSCKVKKLRTGRVGFAEAPLPCHLQKE